MLLRDILLAFAVALGVTCVFVVLLRFRGPWPGFLAFLAVLFLATWAGGIWIRPAGPLLLGVYWVPFVVTAIVVALLLAAAGPPRRGKVETIQEVKQREETAAVATNYLFWAVIVLLVLLIILEYSIEWARSAFVMPASSII